MANVLVNDTYLKNIGDAIRTKLSVETTYKPSEMASAILSIPSGGEYKTIDFEEYALDSTPSICTILDGLTQAKIKNTDTDMTGKYLFIADGKGRDYPDRVVKIAVYMTEAEGLTFDYKATHTDNYPLKFGFYRTENDVSVLYVNSHYNNEYGLQDGLHKDYNPVGETFYRLPNNTWYDSVTQVTLTKEMLPAITHLTFQVSSNNGSILVDNIKIKKK